MMQWLSFLGLPMEVFPAFPAAGSQGVPGGVVSQVFPSMLDLDEITEAKTKITEQ